MHSLAFLKAEAAKAEREANAIFAEMAAAAQLDRNGSRPLIPTGFEAEAERASDLIRRACVLNAEADEMRGEAMPVAPQPSRPPTSPIAKRPAFVATKPVAPVETAETVAARILNSDSVALGTRLVTSAPKQSGAADTIQDAVARILKA